MSDHAQRFIRVRKLLGTDALERLRQAHVAVIGVGGVGSWAVEALARSGVGRLTIVDNDIVQPTNINRQCPALENTLGQPKVEVLAARLALINPGCHIQALTTPVRRETTDALLDAGFDYVLDAIDSLSHKCHLVAECRRRNLPIITSGGAARRKDPTRIRITDLAFTHNDRLLQEIRSVLRTEYDFPRRSQPFGVEAVYSLEHVDFAGQKSIADDLVTQGILEEGKTGLGSACYVTGAFGFAAAAHIVSKLAGGPGVAEPLPPL